MQMIIGGAFQGKSTYAKEHYPNIDWKNGGELDRELLFQAKGVLNFEEFLRKELKEGNDADDLAEELFRKNPEVILVCQEVGYGVVPMDKFDRIYREKVGRVCTELAKKSNKVVRVICGIGTVIKDA